MDRKILTDLAAKYVEEVMEVVNEYYRLKAEGGENEQAAIGTVRQRVMNIIVQAAEEAAPLDQMQSP
jgi:hypothetical protein